jgi:PAS domain S-box-containing protein
MKRILIVDDSPLILAQLTDILTSLGYETVGSAASGAEAIDLARTLRPDAILMDIVMPGEPDGIDAARLIIQELDIPTIFLTGSRNADVLSKIKETGAYGYIEKPVSQSEIGAAIEIALQKKQSVRKITDLYEDLVENTSDFVYVLDGRGDIRFLNRAVCRALGEPLDRLKGRSFRDLITPESYKYAQEVFARQLAGEKLDTFELELYDAQKNVRIIEIRERLISENGRVVEVHGIGRDVTDLKRREEFYRKREERYRVITENMKDTVWVLDKNLRPVFASPSVERARGYTLEEIKKLPLNKNLTPASYDIITKSIVGMLNRAKAETGDAMLTEVMDLEWNRKDGTTYWTEVALTLITDEKGNLFEVLGVGRDITERIIKERVLRESEERYRAIFENAAFGIFHSSVEGSFIRVNAAVARILGYDSPDDVISSIKDFQNDLYVNPEDRQKAIEIIAGQEGWGFFESQWRRKDGRIIIARVHIRLVYGPDGDFHYVEGILEDVTEERSAQQLVQYLKEFNETIINNMVDSIDIIDKDYTIIFQNSTAKRKFGEGVGRKCHEFYHGRDNPCVYCMAPEALTQRRCSSREVQMEDGTFLEVHSSPIKMPDGTLCSMEIMRDITERKRAEEALKASEEKHRTILHTIEDGYFEVDLKGSFTSYNNAMRTMIGYDSEEMVGLNYRKYMDTEIADNVFKTFNEIFLTGTPAKTMDWRLNRKDGTKLDIETSISLARDRSGNPAGFFGIARDSSERRKAEEALRDSEQRYRLLAENANDVIFTADINMNITYASPSVIRLLGFSPEEVTAQPVSELLTPASLALAVDTLREELEIEAAGIGDPNRMRLLELEEYCQDGSTVWTETILSFLRDSKGKPTGILGITRDITERRKAEEAIRESERLYRLLAENAKDVIFTIDMNLRFTYVSPSITSLRGFTVQEALLQTPEECLTPESLSLVMDSFREELALRDAGSLDSTRTKTIELEMICKDGSTVWTETTFSALVNEDGTTTEIIGIIRDISARRKAEEALRLSEEKFRNVFETSRDLLYIATIDGKMLEHSKSAKELLGYSDEELSKMNLQDHYAYPEERDRFVRKILDEGYLENYELKLKKKSGVLVDTLITAAIRRDASGAVIGLQGAVKDITRMKRLEQQLLQSEKLSGLGTMISGVAHELNNPLTVIMGNTELMLMDKSISLKDNKSLRIIFKESERAAKIVSGLLTFAREHRPERRTIKINDIIEESYRLREYNLMTNNIEVILLLSPDIPPILADPYQLQQVFTNIIHNARDALMETGGGTLTIRSFCRGETISIEFEDSGPGITKENMKRIFDPFFTTKDVGKGTGLGLSMAYGIINEHGGTIEAESAAGSGAKFTVELPVITGPDSNIAEPGPPGTTPVKGKLILVVDDERYIRDLLKQALSERGHKIKTASTVEEAIHLSEQNTFDAVVLDIKMPGMGGKELYAHIRNNSPELANRMLFITGDVLSDDTQVFLKTSAAKYIEKPFKIDAFIKALNDVLGI